MDRKWIVLAALTALLLAMGCKSPPPPPPPPPPPIVDTAPPVDVPPATAPDEAVDEVEEPPPLSIQEAQERFEREGLIGDVFYDFDRYNLRADARERLARNAEFMKSSQGKDYVFTVEGHCDERGTNEYNIALGQNRSNAAVDYLVSLGVPAARFKTISYGEERPFCTESTEACWQRNRRARFVISGHVN